MPAGAPYFRWAPGVDREEESLKSAGGWLGAGLALSAAAPLAAQDVLEPIFTDSPPVIDGRLDDDVWQGQQPVSGFRTYNPDYGVEMVADTHVFMAYDAGHLYFAFRAFDSRPGEIKATVTSRDNIFREDWVAVNLDTFGDQQSLYAFYSNPLGIQGDSRYASGNEDRNVDIVWYSEGRIDEDGYTVEMSIPIRSIRFTGTDPVRMGVIFERAIRRVSQSGTSPPLDPARAGQWLNQMRPISYRGIESRRVVELLPAATYTVDRANDAGRLTTAEEQGDLSLTAKYGLTSDLVLDATYNPDFSQVEADAGQVDVNLRYDLFFPEKRPFFLEGREHFGVAATSKSSSDPLRSVLYTRKIVDPVTGAKLAGKVGDRHTVASIYAVDELPGEAAGGGTGYAHVPVLRYKRALSDDNYIGALYAGRETDLGFNRLGGLDGYYRVSESGSVALHGFLSRTRDEPGPAVRGGHAIGARYGVASRNIDYGVAYTDISEDFRADMGFLMRAGVRQIGGELRPKFYPDADFVRRIGLELSTTQTLDTESGRWETANQVGLSNLLFSTLTLRGDYTHSTEIFRNEKFRTGGYSLMVMGRFSNRASFSAQFRSGWSPFYSDEPYQGRSRRVSATLGAQPTQNLDTELLFTYVDFFRDSDSEKVYDYPILRGRVTYQPNRYLFFRAITEYNDFRQELLTDFLVSFTYIPGTVLHVGYGSLYERTQWERDRFVPADRFSEMRRRFFFKTSYLFRN